MNLTFATVQTNCMSIQDDQYHVRYKDVVFENRSWFSWMAVVGIPWILMIISSKMINFIINHIKEKPQLTYKDSAVKGLLQDLKLFSLAQAVIIITSLGTVDAGNSLGKALGWISWNGIILLANRACWMFMVQFLMDRVSGFTHEPTLMRINVPLLQLSVTLTLICGKVFPTSLYDLRGLPRPSESKTLNMVRGYYIMALLGTSILLKFINDRKSGQHRRSGYFCNNHVWITSFLIIFIIMWTPLIFGLCHPGILRLASYCFTIIMPAMVIFFDRKLWIKFLTKTQIGEAITPFLKRIQQKRLHHSH